ncbi:MAG: bacillithiol biosynthesis deacetylase BshB1 [Coriobacteriia bacterium]|nr:bacillithiol biosynthesis deacetylase BshB1 [Coriobacteriia bacterium]
MSHAVCIGAHPDDVEIGMGGTVAAMAADGWNVTILDLTDGEPTPRGTHETRMAEAARAADTLGVTRITLDLPNRCLFDTIEARTLVAEVLRELRPDRVFAPFAVDAHPDHVAASAIADGARFWAKLTKTDMKGEPFFPPRLYRYMAVHLRLVREPAFVFDISEQLATKLEALRCYDSQFGSDTLNHGLIEEVSATARTWGRHIGAGAGEPFFTLEPIGLRDLSALT